MVNPIMNPFAGRARRGAAPVAEKAAPADAAPPPPPPAEPTPAAEPAPLPPQVEATPLPAAAAPPPDAGPGDVSLKEYDVATGIDGQVVTMTIALRPGAPFKVSARPYEGVLTSSDGTRSLKVFIVPVADTAVTGDNEEAVEP